MHVIVKFAIDMAIFRAVSTALFTFFKALFFFGWPAAHAYGAPRRRDAAPVAHLAAALMVTMLALTGRAPLRRR